MRTADRVQTTYTIDVDTPHALRTFYVTIDPAPGGWWATARDPHLTYAYGAPRVPLSPDGCISGAPQGGPLIGPCVEALGRAITRHFHGGPDA